MVTVVIVPWDLLGAENFPEIHGISINADIITAALQNIQWIHLLFQGISTGVLKEINLYILSWSSSLMAVVEPVTEKLFNVIVFLDVFFFSRH